MTTQEGPAHGPQEWYARLMGKTLARSVYDEWLALGEGVRAEIVEGRIVTMPRPTPAHASIARAVCRFVGGPFHDDDGYGGPGGWYIFPEVDVRLVSGDVVVPDLAGWRRERLAVPNVRPIDVMPDWVCEIVSPSNAAHDRVTKRRLYAEHGVPHYWVVDPMARTLEAYALRDGSWVDGGAFDETDMGRIAPFEAIELPVGRLFLVPHSRP